MFGSFKKQFICAFLFRHLSVSKTCLVCLHWNVWVSASMLHLGSSFFLFNVMSGSQLLRLHISLLPCYTTCMHDPSALNTQQCESYNLTWPKTLATYCQCESRKLSWPKTLATYCQCESRKLSWPKTLATYCQCESYNLSWPKTLARYCHSCICELSKVSIIVTETFTSHSFPTFLKALILYSTVCLLIFWEHCLYIMYVDHNVNIYWIENCWQSN